MIFASWVGTYLDLLLVEKQFYSFPFRLFPDLFKFNVLFTLFILPLGTFLFLYAVENLRPLQRFCLMLFISLAMAVVEQLSEQMGWFAHGAKWSHFYSFLGYTIFMWMILKYHRWMNK